MLSEPVAAMLREARASLGLTQQELAQRAGVSNRLWAEMERGERPNVSFETALRMFQEAGVTLEFTGPLGSVIALQGRDVEARAARAALRRRTWDAVQGRLDGPSPESREMGPVERLAATARVSEQAHAVARARRVPARGR